MSWLSRALGNDRRRNAMNAANGQLDAAAQQYQNPNAGMDQLRTTVQSLYSQALPQFQQQLQGVRENAIQRGISTGDLGTTNEGDLASAFQKHLADAISGLSFDNMNNNAERYLSLVGGKADRAQADINNNRNMWGGILGGLTKLGAGWLAGG